LNPQERKRHREEGPSISRSLYDLLRSCL
jgi:hypothetical protein